jgi:opacity protein-like surface antigen
VSFETKTSAGIKCGGPGITIKNSYDCYSNSNLKGIKMKVHITKFSTIAIASLIALVMASTVCNAQDWSRDGKKHVFLGYQLMKNDWQQGLDDNITYGGIGVGLDVTDHWSWHMDFLFWSDVSSDSTDDENVGEWDIFNLDYNFSADRLTPFVTGGVGCIWLSGRDDDTDICGNFGAGVRWDVTDDICIKAAYRYILTDGDLHGLSLSIARMF